MANDLFGTKAALVLYHRERVQELNGARLKAIEDYRKQGSEREKQASEAASRTQAEQRDIFHSDVQNAKAKYPDLFAPVEGDATGNTLLEQGEALTDLAFQTLAKEDVVKLPKSVQEKLAKGQFDAKEMARVHAAIRTKAAAFDRTVHQLRAAKKQIDDLKAQLAEFQASAPEAGQGGGREPGPADDSMEGTLSTMDRYANA
jgi:uncharacterized sporulation protein YeaH/YhbH (DUF444 family)